MRVTKTQRLHLPLEIRHLYSKESGRLPLPAEGLQQPVQMLSMLLRYPRTFSPVARPYMFWNCFQTTLSCTAGVIWLGISVTSSFPTIAFWLAYANFKWKRMMLIVMLASAKTQQLMATPCLRKALDLQATQWNTAIALASPLASLPAVIRAGGEREVRHQPNKRRSLSC